MQNRFSDSLLNISALLMTARDKREYVKIANELNDIILKAMEMENAGTISSPQEEKKTLSAEIKFSKKEVDKMSKTFKKEFIANGCVAHIIKRPSGRNNVYYEIRYRRNGYNISVSNANLETAKKLFIEATKHLDKPTNKKNKFGNIVKDWLEYKKGVISLHQWQNHSSRAERFIPKEMLNKQIQDIKSNDIDKIVNSPENSERMYEELRSLFNQIFKFAIANGIINYNPVLLIPFKRAERQNREAMTKEQIKTFFKNLQQPEFERIRQCAYVLYFFGLRPCELDEEAHFENGFLICRNRKRKNGKIEYKKIPIPEQAKEFIDFDKPITYPIFYNKSAELIKKALGNGFTPYNLRHTFTSICAEYVRQDIVEIWIGDSPERLIGKTYIHFSDEFMIEQIQKVKFIT